MLPINHSFKKWLGVMTVGGLAIIVALMFRLYYKASRPSITTVYDVSAWKQSVSGIKPRYSFAAKNLTEAEAWQRRLRARFMERLGEFPTTKTPLQPRLLTREVKDGYVMETVQFHSRDKMAVFAYFLRPTNATSPLPALLCLHGHGFGVDPLVGITPQSSRKKGNYQHEMALQAVRHGYAVLAIELLGFGRRREGKFSPASQESDCQTLAGTALMLGQTLAGWRVYDSIRALDYMQTRPEIDNRHLGVMGISGGGLTALYLGAIDTRVQTTVISGFLNTYRDSIMAKPNCIDNFVPNLLLDAEMSDIAGLTAPRALWCENGTRDPSFPVQSFRHALLDVKHIYAVFGAPEQCDGEVFEGVHEFHGVGAWAFLEKHLKAEQRTVGTRRTGDQ